MSYLLRTCPACAAPLADDAPRCVRCRTRYCSATCQQDHWRRGHKQMCKKIHRGGDAERYYANKKYKEAVAEAVEKCADDTKGQKCYICLDAVHESTGEGLVRECACRERSGFAHLTCLVRGAKLLCADGPPAYTNVSVGSMIYRRWKRCPICKEQYRGAVLCAMGWACWAEYSTTVPFCPETKEYDGVRTFVKISAMDHLANSLLNIGRCRDARLAFQALIATLRADYPDTPLLLDVLQNLSSCYVKLGWVDSALDTAREIWSLKIRRGRTVQELLEALLDFATLLISMNHFREARIVLCAGVYTAEQEDDLGPDHDITIQIKHNYARALWGYHFYGYDGYRDDLRKAIEILEDLVQLDPIRSGLFDAREEEKGEMNQSQAIVGTLVRARNEQLDWCIHDLTPETFRAFL